MDKEKLKSAVRNMVFDLVPELRLGKTRLAKVVAVHNQGGIGNLWRRRFYAVDLEVLDKDGIKDLSFDRLDDVELPQDWPKAGGGKFSRPEVGAVYRIGFDYYDENQPYIICGTGRGSTRIPPGEAGSYGIWFSGSIYQMITRLGVFVFKTSQSWLEETGTKSVTVKKDFNETSGTRKIETGALTLDVSGDCAESVSGEKASSASANNLSVENDNRRTVGGDEVAVIFGLTEWLITNRAMKPDALKIKALVGDISFETVLGVFGIKNELTSLLELSEMTLDLIRDLKVVNWTGTSNTTPDVIAATEMLKMQFNLLLKK